MEETILHALYLKQLQLGFMALCVLTASILSIYNLPWKDLEFTAMTSGIVDTFRRIYTGMPAKFQSSKQEIGQKMT